MSLHYFIVNHTKKLWYDEMNKLSELNGDYDLVNELFWKLAHEWRGDSIDIIAEFDIEVNSGMIYDGYKAIKCYRDKGE